MTNTFFLNADYGLQINFEYSNKLTETVTGIDYINAQWANPITKINFSNAWFNQSRYDYLIGFFDFVKGSEGLFKVQLPIDYDCQNIPLLINGINIQGVVIDYEGNKRLCKRYSMGGFSFTRPVFRIGNFTLYDDNGIEVTTATVDTDTGIVSNGSTVTSWSGDFYVLARFDNDTLPSTLISYDSETNQRLYNLRDLSITEVKEDNLFAIVNIAQTYNHTLFLNEIINLEITRNTKTDIFKGDSGFDSRDSVQTAKLNLTFGDIRTDYWESEYLIALMRLTLGNYSRFDFSEAEADITGRFRFSEPISFTTLSVNEDTPLFNASVSLTQDNTSIRSSYCRLWTVRRADGVVLGFTDHDSTITFQQTDLLGSPIYVYKPQNPLLATSSNRTAELKTDSTELSGAFSIEVTELDVRLGLYDNAELLIDLFDWINNTKITRLFTGNLGGYSVNFIPNKPKSFEIQAYGLSNKLDASRNVKTTSLCRHKFLSQGYGNCNLSPTGQQFTGTVVSHSGATIEISGISTGNIALCEKGLIEFTSGLLEGKTVYILSVNANTLTLLYPTPYNASNGDTVRLTKHCAKTVEACEVFGNTVNFGGQPRLPGIDETVSRPN